MSVATNPPAGFRHEWWNGACYNATEYCAKHHKQSPHPHRGIEASRLTCIKLDREPKCHVCECAKLYKESIERFYMKRNDDE